MPKIAIAVHGGAGPDSEYIQQNQPPYKQGIQAAIDAGYAVLEKGGRAVDAVEAAVNALENNHLFNAGRGAALNHRAEVEMCASIMDGSNLQSGAVAIVKQIKNPVSLAKAVMEKSRHLYLGGAGAKHFAEELGMEMETDAYFITDHAYEQYKEKKQELRQQGQMYNNKMHGTVGAVALDSHGNIAASTSTGGTECNYEGRIGDSSMAGSGNFANNKTCAVSATGDGEYNIQFVSAFHVSALIEYKGLKLKDACEYLIHEKCRNIKGDMGLIALNTSGEIAMVFNSDRMHRGWKTDEDQGHPEIY
ncbi:MAG: Isoaspartyl aminopeptidase @ Asp-X dipeptidase [uncultured Segetibacter sp.]|uniref:Isoaspartyl peptidase n=1 Tax=uncultured Segetibacter sp. TaxID=481133 RepID=A0A6J4TAX4_9BACT|nr:MAG: Isoaspartyl aminopeptidase @ Asp-X dipeptidase [uncultured Segetibacter sp.]